MNHTTNFLKKEIKKITLRRFLKFIIVMEVFCLLMFTIDIFLWRELYICVYATIWFLWDKIRDDFICNDLF